MLGVTTESGGLRVRIWDREQEFETSFLFYNTHSLPQRQEDSPNPSAVLGITKHSDLIRDASRVANRLVLTYRGGGLGENSVPRDVITRIDRTPFGITEPFHIAYEEGGEQSGLIRDPWVTPFLYADGQHAFFVTTTSPEEDAGGPGIGVVIPDPGVRIIPDRLLSELGVGTRLFPADELLAGAPPEVVLDDVPIGAHGRTLRTVPTNGGKERHG